MSASDDRRRELEDQGYTGETNEELNQLNRGLTDGMTDAQLFERTRTHPDECGQAKAALRRRGHDI